jgi:hypothetical protein
MAEDKKKCQRMVETLDNLHTIIAKASDVVLSSAEDATDSEDRQALEDAASDIGSALEPLEREIDVWRDKCKLPKPKKT